MARRKNKRNPKKTLASQADRYVLYQRSVQSPEVESKFFDRVFRSEFGRKPMVLREDFCGTAAVCADWVSTHSERTAYGVDLDPDPLAWGEKHNLGPLSEERRSRVKLIQDDVRTAKCPKAEVLAAQNFSYFLFETRPTMLEYFKTARRNLAREGLMVLDVLGGWEIYEEDREEITEHDDFDYVWDLKRYDPITGHADYEIHFRFPDGSELEKAFLYSWRQWGLPELRELLDDAGFSRTDVYWEGTDRKTGEGNGVYRKRDHGESDPAWVCYLVAVK